MKYKGYQQLLLPPLTLFIIIIVLWQYISSRALIGFWVIPSPQSVINVFMDYPHLIWMHLKPTLIASISGLLLAFLLGLATALAMHACPLVKRTLYPYLIISQTIPIIAVAPVLVLWFGFGIAAKIFTVILVSFFPIALGFYDGLRQVNQEQILLLRSMGANTWETYRLLYIPASLPSLFTGLKLAATYSVMGAVIGEWLGGNAGLGIYMTRATKSFQTAHVFAVILVIVVLSMSLFGIVALLDRLLLAWYYKKEAEYKDIK
ncbi:MAG: ABC transporter permease [Candidatus Cloacimonetes bacterium]|nr:ABC transporter permease [Candidatus Cloacimonadota bacterium]